MTLPLLRSPFINAARQTLTARFCLKIYSRGGKQRGLLAAPDIHINEVIIMRSMPFVSVPEKGFWDAAG